MPGKSAADRIFAAIRAVPAGQVAGYGEIARRAGLPGRARLVARLLSENADPKLPWHRVLRSDGRIAFPPEHAAFDEQQQRLRAEGVLIRNGKVLNQRAAPTLDELIWSPPARKKS
jgi:methylated-DNA-protein-cysteine methyltransferase-like protein